MESHRRQYQGGGANIGSDLGGSSAASGFGEANLFFAFPAESSCEVGQGKEREQRQ